VRPAASRCRHQRPRDDVRHGRRSSGPRRS
jgi:hypothetical protein